MPSRESEAPEYRRDALSGRWVVIAGERASRPGGTVLPADFPTDPVDPVDCPFCEGNESLTPGEIDCVRSAGPANGPGWRVRVVPNRYPAVRADAGSSEGDPRSGRSTLFESTPGIGVHEVVIESPRHRATLCGESDAQMGDVLRTYRERFLAIARAGRYPHALLFKNSGRSAGASQEHVHSQIVALPFPPALIEEGLRGAERYLKTHARCVLCDSIEEECGDGRRVIARTNEWIAWCPWASRFPLEAWIAPIDHRSRYEEESNDRLGRLAGFVRHLLVRLAQMLPMPAYNYLLHTAPLDGAEWGSSHWRLELAPRTVGLAGFEIGAGMHINPLPPEEAARRWRGEA